VELVTHSALINHGGGMVKDRGIVAPQPVHWVLHLFGTQPGRVPVPVELKGGAFDSPGNRLPRAQGVPWLDPLALLSEDGKTLVLIVINRHPHKTFTAQVTLEGFAAGRAEVARFAPGSLGAVADTRNPDALRPRTVRLPAGPLRVEFPPCSVTRLIIPRASTMAPR
jgi:alpha-N-arabinofuranosidase